MANISDPCRTETAILMVRRFRFRCYDTKVLRNKGASMRRCYDVEI
jgi:hypothetical protein